MEQPRIKQELSLGIALALLRTPTELEGITPQSKSSGDTAQVLIRSTAVGRLLKELDPEEEFIHVVEYSSQAEIWPAAAWRESNTRRNKLQAQSEVDRSEWSKRTARLAALEEKLTQFGLAQKPGYTKFLAESIYSSWKAGKYSDMLKVLQLGEVIAGFESEDKQHKL